MTHEPTSQRPAITAPPHSGAGPDAPDTIDSIDANAGIDPHAQRYDEVPYPNLVHGRTHPRTTGAIAALFGITPPDPSTARVLDLGCAAGMNILAMAADTPTARFLGVDISEAQIAMGNHMATELGLDNIAFRCGSFADLGDLADASFDYIICHGVFSWVAPPLRDVILTLVSRLLAPAGLAFVSYNTYPGWHFGNIVRDLMLREMDPDAPPLERVHSARKTLERHLDAAEDKSLRRALLMAERETLVDHSDSYLFHEYLTPEHHPLWFKDFAALARQHGLAYVADALPGIVLPSTQDGRLAVLLDALPEHDRQDPIAQQQAIDEHLNNRFRRSILVKQPASPTLTLDPNLLSRLHVRLPREHILIREHGGPLSVRDRRSRLIPIHLPAAAEALEALRTASPASVPMTTLCDPSDPANRPLLGTLVGLVFAEVLDVTLTPVRCATTLPSHPAVPRINRFQARRGDPIASRLFVSEIVGELGAMLISRLDGSRCFDELVSELGVSRERIDTMLKTFVERAILLPPDHTADQTPS